MAARKSEKKSSKKKPAYKRILLKLSGESLQGPLGLGVHGETLQSIARELKEVRELGVEIAIVVGGGNIFRGGRQKGFEIERSTGDYMGMLATVINALALQDALEKVGVFTRVLSAIEMHDASSRKRAGGDFWRGHGQSLFFHGHCSGFACDGNEGRRDLEGHARGR